jgi:two-component system LytT family sensor kinase
MYMDINIIGGSGIELAIAKMSNGSVIEVSAMCQYGSLPMDVADNGPVQNTTYLADNSRAKDQTASSHTCVGVQNIIVRLNVLYPDNHNFNTTRDLTAGYCMRISISEEHS